jgi:mono/diheme cytochrome c family protein
MTGKQFSLLRACTPLAAALLVICQAACSGKHEPTAATGGAVGTVAPAAQSLIERGKYLARAGNCGACHTAANGELAGGVAFDTPFGKIYSANITPDVDSGIGKWTRDDFLQSLRKGVRPSGEHLYPVFPYTAFTKITDEDAAALYAYLKSVPAVHYVVPAAEMSFPYNRRSLLYLWKALFFDDGPYNPDARKSAEWNRGAYLITALGHCSACHSPRNSLGAERSSLSMTGGVYQDRVPGGATRPWSAPNLTSLAQGMGAWPAEEIIAYLKTGTNSYAATFGPMNEVIMNGTRHLSDADLRAMAIYLKDLPANEGELAPSAKSEVLQAGETVYNVNCGTCHEPNGLGAEDAGPRLAGSLIVQARSPASLINSILQGPDLPNPAPPTHAWRPMEAYADKLSDEEIASLASYLRSAWNNKGGEVTAEQVAKQR